jgi:predicted ATPase
VLAGVWTLDAARHVCADDEQFGADVLPTLRELIDKSLVRAVPGHGVMRFSLASAVREYGAELLDSAGETDGTRARHAAWCHGLATELAVESPCTAHGAAHRRGR